MDKTKRIDATRNRFELSRIREVIRENAAREGKREEANKLKVYTMMFMTAVCALLTVMNIINKYTVMTCATGGMTLGLIAAVYFFTKPEKEKIGNILVTFIIAVAFSFFAISGRNDGFAILWIMLVPAIASNVLNLRLSLMLSGYFQLLLFGMFYTPLRAHFLTHYTETFCIRFPVLYLATFIVSYIIVVEKEFYAMQLEALAHTDVLTGLANRREYEGVLKELDEKWDEIEHLRIFSMDLNGLKKANDTLGHVAGDELLKGAAECISAAFPDALIISRIGGDEFALITEQNEDVIDIQMAHLSDNIRMWRGKTIQRLSISSGSASKDEHPGINVYELSNLADQEMYDEKRRYYSSAGVDRRRSHTLTTRGVIQNDDLVNRENK